MAVLNIYNFEDLIKPRKLRLVRNLDSGRISQFKYAAENDFRSAGIGIGTELPIEEFSRINKWVKVALPYTDPQRYLKLTEDEIKAFFHLSI